MATTSDFMSPDEFLIAMGTSVVLRSWLDGRVHLKLGLMGSVAKIDAQQKLGSRFNRGVGAGIYTYDVVVKKFKFAISSPGEFLV